MKNMLVEKTVIVLYMSGLKEEADPTSSYIQLSTDQWINKLPWSLALIYNNNRSNDYSIIPRYVGQII